VTIHRNIRSELRKWGILLPDDKNIEERHRIWWYRKVLEKVWSETGKSFADKKKNHHYVMVMMSELIKHQGLGYFYFHPGYYQNNRVGCQVFFRAWQTRVHQSRSLKRGWKWHAIELGDHEIDMLEIK
jgi:hypothetical protein